MQTNTNTNLHYSLNQTLKNKVFKSKSHSMNTFKNKSSYSFKRTLSISIITSILLSNQLVLARSIDNNTLPNGGKFVGGSGSIGSCGSACMDIKGDKNNNVIAWGGGFNIGKDAIVNFKGSDKGYLNLDYSKNPSILAGKLNGGDNNIFIVNPSGVLITETGSINANRFVASTSPMSIDDINTFGDPKTDSFTFSPVFKPSKAGDIINKGNINANEVLLIGNNVRIVGGSINGKHKPNTSNEELKNSSGTTNKELHLVGNNVFIDADSSYIKSNKINLTATNKAEIQRTMISFAEDDFNFYKNIQGEIVKADYKDYTNNITSGKDFQKIVTLGNMGDEKKNAIEWWYFANGWNNYKRDIRSIDEFRLVGDIDFSGNKGEGEVGKDWQNYANFWIDLNGDGLKQESEYTSMIVGNSTQNAFDKNFNGQGFKLSNINIDTSNSFDDVGIFGYITGGEFNNLVIDYNNGNIKSNSGHTGGFAGRIINGNFENISLSNMGSLSGTGVGGFAGGIDNGTFTNISLSNIKNIDSEFAGGFAGTIGGGNFTNVSLSNITSILGTNDAGGFSGIIDNGALDNISLNNIGNITSYVYAGGFAGEVSPQSSDKDNVILRNISLNDITSINGSVVAGGFAGRITNGTFTNIALNNITSISATSNNSAAGGFAGEVVDNGAFDNIVLNNIEKIEGRAYAGGFVGNLHVTDGKVNITDIYMYFNPQASLTTEEGESLGTFVGLIKVRSDGYLTHSNINLYSTNQDFLDKTALSQDLQGGTYIGNGVGKIKINNQTEFINAVKSKFEDQGLKVIDCGEGKKCLSFAKDFDITPPSNNNNNSSFKDENNDGLNDVVLSSDDFSKDILDEILANLKFDLVIGDINSIIQTLDFLRYFNEKDVGIQSIFKENGYNLVNKDTSDKLFKNFENIKTALIALNNLGLKSYQDAIKKFNSDYELYLETKGSMTEEGLAGIEKDLKAQREKLAKDWIEISKGLENFEKAMQVSLGEEFNLNDSLPMFEENSMAFNAKFNAIKISCIGNECNNNSNSGGDSDQTIISPLKDINASMINKEKVVLVKPAEEEKQAIEEEKGTLNSRTCVVSENFKTNNPCMAQRI